MKRSAFTLIELLVVLAIIMVLVAMLVVACRKARDAADRMGCASNLHQLDLALRMYYDDWGRKTPTYPNPWNKLLPYTEGNAKVLLCPAKRDAVLGTCNYLWLLTNFDAPDCLQVAWDGQPRHPGGKVNVLFNDGHVENRLVNTAGVIQEE